MEENTELTELLNIYAKVLIRAFCIGLIILFVWFIFFLFCSDFAFDLHSEIFEITRKDFNRVNYYGMTFMKLALLIFFLLPYIAVKMIVKKIIKNDKTGK